MSTAPTKEETMLEREEDQPVIEEGFTPLSQLTVMKKNGRYIAVANKNIKQGELVEKCGFVVAPYKSNEPDQRAKQLANILPVLPCACNTCKIVGPSLVIPSGNMIFIQFNQEPNVDIEFNTQNATIELRSNTRIHKGDELFINYASLYPQTELSQESMFKEDPFNANV